MYRFNQIRAHTGSGYSYDVPESVNQKNYYDYILEQHPRRVIFNPGAENPEFEKILTEKGIQTIEACTLVLLGTGQY